MTLTRYSNAKTLVLLATLLVAVAAPAAAVSITNESIDPGEAAVGDTVEATFTFDDLYQSPNFPTWTLQGQSEMNNVTWIVTLKNPSDETIVKKQYSGGSFSLADVSADSQYGTVVKVTVTVRGETPAVDSFSYEEPENFTVAKLTQKAGESGSTNTLGTWNAHHYTTGTENNPGSREARQAISTADEAIANASDVGANTGEAESSLKNAIDAYDSGEFKLAVTLANEAQSKAEKAQGGAQQGQMLLYGGLGLVALLLVGGGVWYWRSQQDDYDKLG